MTSIMLKLAVMGVYERNIAKRDLLKKHYWKKSSQQLHQFPPPLSSTSSSLKADADNNILHNEAQLAVESLF